MRRDARLPPSHIALQLWQRRRLRRRLGTERGGGGVALMPCRRGRNFQPPPAVFCMISSLWLADPRKQGFSLPPPPLSGSTSRRSQLADELSRWGTQHKEMSHPLTQTVRCCCSFPCKFAQALWEWEFCFCFGLASRFPDPQRRSEGDAGTAAGRAGGGRFPQLQDLGQSSCGARGCGASVVSVQKTKKIISANRRTHLPLLRFVWLRLGMIVERCLELLIFFFLLTFPW